MSVSITKTFAENQPDMPKFQKELRMGFELELLGCSWADIIHNDRWPSGIKKQHGHPDINSKWWGIGRDGTLPEPSAEIRSPVNPPMEHVIAVLKALKSMGCYVGATCGFHVHVSHPRLNIGINIKKKLEYWSSRQEWVGDKNLNYTKITDDDDINYDKPPDPDEEQWYKYQAIYRVHEKHLEVRVFNCSLSPIYILNRLRLVQKSVVLDPVIKCKVKAIPFVETKSRHVVPVAMPETAAYFWRQ